MIESEQPPVVRDESTIQQQPLVVREERAVVVDAYRSRRAREQGWPWSWRTVLRYALVAVALFVVGWILWVSSAALTPFIFGLVLAYLMMPLVRRLDQWLPRWASILIVYAGGFFVVGAGLSLIVPPAATQIREVVERAPEFYASGRAQVDRGIAYFNRNVPPEVRDQVNQQVNQVQETVQANASRYAQSVGEVLFNSVLRIFQTLTFLLGFLIIPFFLYYVLADADRIPVFFNSILHPRIRADWWNVLRIIDSVFGKFIRGQLILGAIIGACSFIGLQILGLFGFNVPFTVLLAIVAAIGEMIPVIGPIITAIPAILVGFTDGWQTGLAVTVLYVIIQQVENQVLVPRVTGNALRLHAAVLLAVLVVASQLGGLLLVILSAPLTAIGRDVFIYFHQRLSEPPVPAEVALQTVMGADNTEGS